MSYDQNGIHKWGFKVIKWAARFVKAYNLFLYIGKQIAAVERYGAME